MYSRACCQESKMTAEVHLSSETHIQLAWAFPPGPVGCSKLSPDSCEFLRALSSWALSLALLNYFTCFLSLQLSPALSQASGPWFMLLEFLSNWPFRTCIYETPVELWGARGVCVSAWQIYIQHPGSLPTTGACHHFPWSPFCVLQGLCVWWPLSATRLLTHLPVSWFPGPSAAQLIPGYYTDQFH